MITLVLLRGSRARKIRWLDRRQPSKDWNIIEETYNMCSGNKIVLRSNEKGAAEGLTTFVLVFWSIKSGVQCIE